ncbi:MAG: hypothetical protein U1D69_04570, partial [Polynucleobacter sp.]|nr:hypothetical protein [Polynucleobacter sp.]
RPCATAYPSAGATQKNGEWRETMNPYAGTCGDRFLNEAAQACGINLPTTWSFFESQDRRLGQAIGASPSAFPAHLSERRKSKAVSRRLQRC